MSNNYLISDLHLEHKNVVKFAEKFRPGLGDIDVHDEVLITNICNRVTKRDTLWVLGDINFGTRGLEMLSKVPARMMLVRGNHDDRYTTKELLTVFEEVYGLVRFKKHWLSHAPIHPDELRGKDNIHGHVHQNSIRTQGGEIDSRYINVCVEALDGMPINYLDILNGYYHHMRRC